MANAININITANTTQAQAQIQALQSTIQQSTSQVNSSLSNMGSSFSGLNSNINSSVNGITGSTGRLSGIFNSIGASFQRFTGGARASATGASTAMSGIASNVSSSASSIASSTSGIGSAFGGIVSAINPVGIAIAGVTLAAAGIGLVFKNAVADFTNMTEENIRLSQALQLPVGQASALRIAMDNANISTDDYVGALKKLESNIRSNEERMLELGLKTRDASGAFRNTNDVMNDAVGIMTSHKAGLDQDLVSMELFGKNTEIASKFTRLSSEALKDAAEQGAKLGTITNQLDVDAFMRYDDAADALKTNMEGLTASIGSRLLPAFTTVLEVLGDLIPPVIDTVIGLFDVFGSMIDFVGNTFMSVFNAFKPIIDLVGQAFTNVFGDSGNATSAMDVFKNSFKVVAAAFNVFALGLELGCEHLRYVFSLVVEGLKTLSLIAVAALNLDWNGVKSAMSSGASAVEKQVREHTDRIVKITEDGKKKIDLSLGVISAPKVADKIAQTDKQYGNVSFKPASTSIKTPKAQTVDPQIAINKATFNLLKANSEAEINLEKEKNKQLLNINDRLFANNKISLEEYYSFKEKIIKKDFESQIALKQQELVDAKSATSKDEAEKLRIKERIVKIQGQINLLSLQEQNSISENIAKLNEELDTRARISGLTAVKNKQADKETDLSIDRIVQEQKLALGEITNIQLLEMEKQREQQSYNIALEGLQKRKELSANNFEELLAIEDEILNLKRNYAVKQIEINKSIVLESKKDAIAIKNTFQSSFQDVLGNFMSGKKSFKDSITDMIGSITDMFNKLIAQKLAERIFAGGTGQFGGGIFDSISGLFGGSGGSSSSSGGGGFDFGGILGSIGSFLPSFDVGSNYVPNDMVAKIHKGERIVPAKYNNADYGSKTNQNLNVVNNFNLSQATDRRTQMQMAAMAGSELQKAMKRNN